jgi:hypothetical protein
MQASSIEYLHAMFTLAEAGITGSDARTCLQVIDERTPDITYQEFLTELRTLKGDTLEDTNRILVERFGSDAVRAARVLQERA